jgi:Zn-dependent metalloprotease
VSMNKKQRRITAIAATAAIVAAGITAGTANAGQTAPESTLKTGALPAALTTSQHADLIKAADAPGAKAADAKALGLGAKEELKVKDVIKNKNGDTHVRYERTYDGLPVIGGDLVVHKSASGKRTGVTRATNASIKVATDSAKADVKPATPKAKGSVAPRKVVFARTGKPVLAWETVEGGTQKSGAPNRMHVITDASTGKTLLKYQGIEEADGTGKSEYSGNVKLTTSGSDGKYSLTDESRGSNKTVDLGGSESGDGKAFSDEDNKWGDGTAGDPQTAAVDAHYGSAQTWDFYKDVFKRNGIADDGKGAVSRVHYSHNYVNAFWDDSCFCMTYGDGEGDKKPLTALDVTAHEMTHGVTAATAGLTYAGESGGLNEATSDIMGTAVEFHSKNAKDVGDYLIGEAIDINGDGKPLRYMDKPSKDGQSLDSWSSKAGDVDVHYSSGIANHFFYLLSEGSGKKTINGVDYDSPTADDSTVKGIGIEKAQAIWFKALTEYMTSDTDYAAARKATISAANDLYGKDSTETKAVESAWTGVAVK